MAGLNCGTPSSLAWPVLQAGLSASVTVEEDEAIQAVADLGGEGISSGASGAATLAGFRAALAAGQRDALGVTAGSTIVLISTEASPELGRHAAA
jgi:diaminopropionate ammonia-lyase